MLPPPWPAGWQADTQGGASEASLAGAVRGPAGLVPSPRIAGILGYDFLRHCRLEIGLPGSPTQAWLRVRRPGGLALTPRPGRLCQGSCHYQTKFSFWDPALLPACISGAMLWFFPMALG